MSIKDLRNLTGLSQKDFGKKYDIPYRTIQNWETEQRSCPEYVENLLERVVLEDSGKRVGYVFSWATSDSYEDSIYLSKYDALKKADRLWQHNSKSEKKEYVNYMVFKIICTESEWDSLCKDEAEYTAADRLECVVKDYLHIMTKEEFIKEALKGDGVQNDSSELWVNVDGNNYSVLIDDVLDDNEREFFDASSFLEDNLDLSAWDDLYELYLQEVKR